MAMDKGFDYSTLSWVKGEIDQSLKQARQALEEYLEDQDDETKLRFCINHIHQVCGTLQVVELYGAALVAEEMEKIAYGLMKNKIDKRNDAMEVLMRSTVQLPDYLERLQSGHKDVPVVLLPLLNDLRAASGEKLLSEGMLLVPDLSIESPEIETSDEDISKLVRKIRHAYQLGLLGWYREKNIESSLEQMANVITQIRAAVRSQVSKQLFWISSGIVEALQQNGLNASVAVKLLMGQVDRQLKHLIDGGEEELSNEPPENLVKNLLYYVATTTSTGERVTELKNAFNLNDLLPSQDEIDEAQKSMTGRNAELMGSVTEIIREDLNRIKEIIDVFVRSDGRVISELSTIVDILSSNADTLGVIGLGIARNVVQEQISIVQEIIDGKQDANEENMMEVASALLYVESALDSLASHSQGASANDTHDARDLIPDAEYKNLIETVIREAKTDIAKVKEAVVSFIDAPWDHIKLDDIPPLLNEINGSIKMLSLDRASNIMDACARYISEKLIGEKNVPTDDELNYLANAVASLEYYLEAFQEKRRNQENILAQAEESLAYLGFSVSLPEGKPQSLSSAFDYVRSLFMQWHSGAREMEGLGAVIDALEDSKSFLSTEPDISREIVETAISSAELVISQAQSGEYSTSDEIVEQFQKQLGLMYQVLEGNTENIPLRRKEDFESITDSDAEEVQELQAPVIENPVDEDEEELGEEIIEIFLEEAGEQIDTIKEMLVAWRQNPEDKEAMSTLRRAYHTLKGSGRLVGATEIGEFAWSIENMLNRVIDNTIFSGVEMFDMLDNATRLLPELVESFKTSGAFPAEAQPIIDKAWELTGATPPPAIVSVASAATNKAVSQSVIDTAEAVLARAEKPSEGESPETDYADQEAMDPVLYEIFSKEASGHIDEVEKYLVDCKANHDDCAATDNLIRALHTLHGSANMAQVLPAAELSGELERYTRLLQENNRLPVVSAVSVIEESIETFRKIIDQLGKDNTPLPSIEDLLDRLGQLSAKVNEGEITKKTDLTAESADDLLTQDEEYDEDLLQIFMEEGEEILDACESALGKWMKSPMDMDVISSIQRQLHTLKGGARMAGIKPMGDLSHSMETMLLAVAEEQVQPTDAMINLVQNAYDDLLSMLDKVKQRQPLEESTYLVEKAQAIVETGSTACIEADNGNTEEKDKPVSGESVSTIGQVTKEFDPVVESVTGQSEEDDDDEELLEVFLEEADEILNACEETLQNWTQSPNDHDVISAIQRQLHTLKGGARMAQIKPIGDLSHIMESMLIAVSEERVPPSDAMVGLVQEAYDELLSMLNLVKQQQTPQEAAALIEKAQKVIDTGSTDCLAVTTEEKAEEQTEQNDAPDRRKTGSGMDDVLGRLLEGAGEKKIPSEKEIEDSDKVIGFPKQTSRGTQEQVRVSAELIDNLVNFGGEVSIYRSRLEQQVNSMKFNLNEMDQTVVRLHDQLRNLDIETEAQMLYRMEEASENTAEFDPLEFDRFSHMQQLSRSLMESVTDIVSIQRMLENITRESETLLLQQSRVNTDLQEGLMRTRMVPFSSQLPRLRRIVRQTASELGKTAELKVIGAEGEMDRTLLDRIMPALEHMLRNSIDHGIESPSARKKAKKPAAGQIKIAFSREGSDVVLRLSDDGGGINLAAIRKKAVQNGLMDKNADITESELLQFILESGFSTAETVTQISGRGVGMDVVNNEIKQLGGSLHIASNEGEGTTFTVALPFTLSINRALMINVADEMLAVPLLSVEGIARINAVDVEKYYKENPPEFEFAGNKYQFMHMGTLLGISRPQSAEPNRKFPLLLVRTGEHRVALQIDSLMGSREIVVKPVGPQLSGIRGVSGATIMGDGRVVLIIDIHALVRMDIAHHITDAEIDAVKKQKEERKEPLVMVVDDSITVRKVTERFLKRNNMVSIVARDGVEALAVLQDTIPDVMLLDIEMPRMDGFELATHMRNDSRFKDVPIIMITSRTGDKHRDRAMQIGVNDYMGKPYKEDELVEKIRFFLDKESAKTH
ncbi:MAG: Hpt domain-containing protein [Gammaproteobacteria bacterium]|nr:Hpt domain-containing protein [Gammaproteobacteria bacterium]